VDAALLRRLCLVLKHQVDPHGVRLRNAAIWQRGGRWTLPG
jgi:hypothetical protein